MIFIHTCKICTHYFYLFGTVRKLFMLFRADSLIDTAWKQSRNTVSAFILSIKGSNGESTAMRNYRHEYAALALILGLLVAIQTASVTGQSVTGLNGAANITSFIPESPAFDTEGNVRTFNIVLDQKATVSWAINGHEVFIESDATQSTYTMTNAPAGVWEVSATASNPNGATKHQWTWIVYASQHSPSSEDDSNEESTNPTGNPSDTTSSPGEKASAVSEASDTTTTLPRTPAAEEEKSFLPLIGGVCIFTVGTTLTIFFLKRSNG
jgi:hypothetical protein